MNNREIKFRYYYSNESNWLVYEFGMEQIENGYPYEATNDNPLLKRYKLIDRVQFTGLKDKNGKEIYEGDIIETDNTSYFKIIWDADIMGFKIAYEGLGDKGWIHVMEGHGGLHTWTVIGNIYENK
jgi:hypothetical protein